MRALLFRLRFVVALLVATVGGGRAVPALAMAVGATTHVCTCASGGDHAACPVCNPSLGDEHRGDSLAAEGVPCGDRRVAVTAAAEWGVLPSPIGGLALVSTRAPVPRAEQASGPESFVEPATPPPRSART